MSDFILYGWPSTAMTIAAAGFGYLWWESRRVDRAIAKSAAKTEAPSHGDDFGLPLK